MKSLWFYEGYIYSNKAALRNYKNLILIDFLIFILTMCNVQIHFHYPPDNNKCGHFKLKPKISNINSTHPAIVMWTGNFVAKYITIFLQVVWLWKQNKLSHCRSIKWHASKRDSVFFLTILWPVSILSTFCTITMMYLFTKCDILTLQLSFTVPKISLFNIKISVLSVQSLSFYFFF